MNYYEHHIGDYAKDAGFLSLLEEGVYRRLLDLYYARERPLPVEVDACCKLARAATPEEREAVAFVLREFFILDQTGHHQRRADAEIDRYRDKQGKAKAAAAASVAARRGQRPLTDRPPSTPPSTNERTPPVEPPFNARSTPVQPPFNHARPSPVPSHHTPVTNTQTTTTAPDLPCARGPAPVPTLAPPREAPPPTPEPPSPSSSPGPAEKGTPAGRLSKALRDAGMSTSRPDLQPVKDLAALGVPTERLVEYYRELLTRARPGDPLNPQFLLTSWRNRASKDAHQAALPSSAPKRPEPPAVVETFDQQPDPAILARIEEHNRQQDARRRQLGQQLDAGPGPLERARARSVAGIVGDLARGLTNGRP